MMLLCCALDRRGRRSLGVVILCAVRLTGAGGGVCATAERSGEVLWTLVELRAEQFRSPSAPPAPASSFTVVSQVQQQLRSVAKPHRHVTAHIKSSLTRSLEQGGACGARGSRAVSKQGVSQALSAHVMSTNVRCLSGGADKTVIGSGMLLFIRYLIFVHFCLL